MTYIVYLPPPFYRSSFYHYRLFIVFDEESLGIAWHFLLPSFLLVEFNLMLNDNNDGTWRDMAWLIKFLSYHIVSSSS